MDRNSRKIELLRLGVGVVIIDTSLVWLGHLTTFGGNTIISLIIIFAVLSNVLYILLLAIVGVTPIANKLGDRLRLLQVHHVDSERITLRENPCVNCDRIDIYGYITEYSREINLCGFTVWESIDGRVFECITCHGSDSVDYALRTEYESAK